MSCSSQHVTLDLKTPLRCRVGWHKWTQQGNRRQCQLCPAKQRLTMTPIETDLGALELERWQDD